jgi:hypothetical protein
MAYIYVCIYVLDLLSMCVCVLRVCVRACVEKREIGGSGSGSGRRENGGQGKHSFF